jgi:hypothetical protein
MKNRPLAIGLSMLFLGANHAAAQQEPVHIRGAGYVSCGEFMKQRDTAGADLFYGQWAMGYISGYNLNSSLQKVLVPETPTILLYAEKFCREDPLKSFHVAIFALVSELRSEQAASRARNVRPGYVIP